MANTSKKQTTTKAKSSSKTSSTKKEVKTQPKKSVKTETKKSVNSKPKEEIKIVKKSQKKDYEQYRRVALLLIACLLLAIILIVVIKGNETQLSNGKEVVASLKGKNIVSEDLFEEMKNKYGTTVLVNMIDEYIVSKEVKNNDEAKESAKAQLDSLKQQYESQSMDFKTVLSNYGYDSEDQLLDEMIVEANKEIVAKKYIRKAISDDEINKYYEDEIYGDYNAKHILIKADTSDDASKEEQEKALEKAKKKAEEVITKLNNGEKWDDLVKKYSDDEGSKDDKGLIENFTKGDVVDEFFDAVLNLKDNEYTKEPVKSQYGYHIILRVSASKKPSLKESKSTILDSLVKDKIAKDSNLVSSTWVDIRKAYNLDIKDTKVKKSYNSTIKKAQS